MAVPGSRAHRELKSTAGQPSRAKMTEHVAEVLAKPEIAQLVENDEDADVSDSEDDSDADSEGDSSDSSSDGGDSDDSSDSDGSEEHEDINAQKHDTPIAGGPAAQTSFKSYVQAESQERKSNKRPAEDDLLPQYEQSTLKKRRALGDISGSNSRTNILASAFEAASGQRSASAQKAAIALTNEPLKENTQSKPRSVSSSSIVRASASGKNWPRLQDTAAFSAATLVDQRAELNSYRKDLLSYINMIEARAIPVSFMESFFRRLDVHVAQMDAALHVVDCLHAKEKERQSNMYSLQKEAMKDHKEAAQLITELALPAYSDS